MPEPPTLDNFSSPARRLVLFVADGLRARSFYVPGAAPYLHHVGVNQGVVGKLFLIVVLTRILN